MFYNSRMASILWLEWLCILNKLFYFILLGVCPQLSVVGGQALNCTDYNQRCTYLCKTGYQQLDSGNGVNTCKADGTWSGGDIQCGRLCKLSKFETLYQDFNKNYKFVAHNK